LSVVLAGSVARVFAAAFQELVVAAFSALLENRNAVNGGGLPASGWLALLEQAANPVSKAMPTSEQPEQRSCWRIPTLLFPLQKRIDQSSDGRIVGVGPPAHCPALVAPGSRFDHWMVML
jgi:hypothetical protein